MKKCGIIYFGNFANNERSGHGVLILKDQYIYNGKWSDGKRAGKGKEYINKSIEFVFAYDGAWLDNEPLDMGRLTDDDASLV